MKIKVDTDEGKIPAEVIMERLMQRLIWEQKNRKEQKK